MASVRPALAVTGYGHRDMGRDLAIDEPAEHRAGAVSSIRDEALGRQIEGIFDAVQHCAHGSDLGLPDRPCGFCINAHGVVGINQVSG